MTESITIEEYSQIQSGPFKTAFRAYFAELGIPLREDTDVFDEIERSGREEGTRWLVLQRDGAVAGFVAFQPETTESRSGFFTQRLGFLRELWVAPALRRRGLGARLVDAAAEALRREGARRLLLTYEEDALGFYERLGFTEDDSYAAKNGENVVVKTI